MLAKLRTSSLLGIDASAVDVMPKPSPRASIDFYFKLGAIVVCLWGPGCDRADGSASGDASRTATGQPKATGPSKLAAERKTFKPEPILFEQRERTPPDEPPPGVFKLIKYRASAGQLHAYVTPDPKDGRKRPAIIWITGGDCNSIGDVWSDADPADDQTAAAFRKAGMVMMFPSLRDGNDNPGTRQWYLGEVNDVLAAREHLAKLPYVDPKRIYLGGHSTGGTMALLTSEVSDKFRAVFAFGAVEDVGGYPAELRGFDILNDREREIRSPGYWLDSVRTPTYVIEGAGGNIESLNEMRTKNTNGWLRFVTVKSADHFSVLAPVNRLLAEMLAADDGESVMATIDEAKLADAMGK